MCASHLVCETKRRNESEGAFRVLTCDPGVPHPGRSMVPLRPLAAWRRQSVRAETRKMVNYS